MSDSWDDLSPYLNANQKTIIRQFCNTDSEFKLFSRKGDFSYQYLDFYEKIQDTTLPPKSPFSNQINGTKIRKEEYKHAIDVWKTFNILNLQQYAEMYLKVNLDSALYYTAPGLALDSLLKIAPVKLELMPDIVIYEEEFSISKPLS